MNKLANPGLLWWVIPGTLAGMSMPFIDPQRRLNGGGALEAYDDELKLLFDSGIRGVVSLLNIPSDAAVYKSAGFEFLCLPVPDGRPPTMEQANEFIHFVSQQHAVDKAVAVHCEAGLGRTGTMLAACLISRGENVEGAIRRIRVAQPGAIETSGQVQFLKAFALSNPTNQP